MTPLPPPFMTEFLQNKEIHVYTDNLISWPLFKSINQSIDQSLTRSITHSANQSINLQYQYNSLL